MSAAEVQNPASQERPKPEPIWTDARLEEECRNSIDGRAILAFRQMRALESIADSLVKLVNPVVTAREVPIMGEAED
jgi:hypothetical protein